VSAVNGTQVTNCVVCLQLHAELKDLVDYYLKTATRVSQDKMLLLTAVRHVWSVLTARLDNILPLSHSFFMVPVLLVSHHQSVHLRFPLHSFQFLNRIFCVEFTSVPQFAKNLSCVYRDQWTLIMWIWDQFLCINSDHRITSKFDTSSMFVIVNIYKLF
jgi:hypothetical protein